MAVSANRINLSGLARRLVLDGLLEEAAAQDHFQKSIAKKQPFVTYLVENKLLSGSAIALSAAWVVLWILARPPTASVELPVVGPVPSPFVALIAAILAGYLLARILGLHARWLGRRWAVWVRTRVAEAVDGEVRERAFARLDDLDDALRRLRAAAERIDATCARQTH